VQAAIRTAITRIRAAGKAAGILTADVAFAREYAELGATFVAFGTDVGLLVRGGEALLRSFTGTATDVSAVPRGAVY
jgi:4-hydroxy-2-oxoheptanedioate aldolase